MIKLNGIERLRENMRPLIWLLVALALLATRPLTAEVFSKVGRSDSKTQPTNAPVQLPANAEQISAEQNRLEVKLSEVRGQAAAVVPEATPGEVSESQNLFRQWVLALDMQSRSLRRLQEIRNINQGRALEAQSWRGFDAKPPYSLALVEDLRDAVANETLEAETDRMLVAISEKSIDREAARLTEAFKQQRLARDEAEVEFQTNQRRQWLARLAEVRVQSNEAILEAYETARLVSLEKLSGLRQHIKFLERKLASAQAKAGFSEADLESVLARLTKGRDDVRIELENTLARAAKLRNALVASRNDLRQAQLEATGAATNSLRDLRAGADLLETQSQTTEIKLDLLRSLLSLADYAENIWRDRFWATGQHSLTELRLKRQSHQNTIEGLRPWKKLAELKLSAASAESLTQAMRASAPNMTAAELEAARQIKASLDERVSLYQKALSALMLVEGAHERLIAELTEREAGTSLAGKAQSALESLGSLSQRVWNTELYVAEDSVIADGQRISVPRSITLGKALLALGIFLGGVLVARLGQGSVKQTAAHWFRARERTAGALAKIFTGIIIVGSLFVAMTSVRIPWTVFAFLGGALAIGVGFGAQTLINNFISGVILIFERSIRVNDIVEVGNQRGKVVSVGFRNSLIKRGDGVDVLVPNSRFLETEVVNWTLTDDLVRYKITVGAAYGSNPKKVSSLIMQAAMEHQQVIKTPSPQVMLEDFGDNALVFTLVFWMELQPNTDGATVRSDLRFRIHALFEESGIILAYPQRDLHIDSTRPLEVRLMNPHSSSGQSPGPSPKPV